MDLTKRIEGTRHFGCEFLTWLWYKSVSAEGMLQTGKGAVELWFEDKISFVSPFAGREVNILKGESPAQGAEAQVAARQGKQIDEARLSVSFQNRRWEFVFNGPAFLAKAVKVPAIPSGGEFEAVIDRFALLATLEEVMISLYHDFLKLRLDQANWLAECRQMERWLAG